MNGFEVFELFPNVWYVFTQIPASEEVSEMLGLSLGAKIAYCGSSIFSWIQKHMARTEPAFDNGTSFKKKD
jgi:hypothetical protein